MPNGTTLGATWSTPEWGDFAMRLGEAVDTVTHPEPGEPSEVFLLDPIGGRHWVTTDPFGRLVVTGPRYASA